MFPFVCFRRTTCKDAERCMICSGSKKTACRETGVTYEINCLARTDPETQCDYAYIGETGKNGYTRGLRHQDDYRNERDSSALWKHCVQNHNSVHQDFEMHVLDRVRNDATKRQILEATRIAKIPEGRRMNSRGEWNLNRVPRISIERD